MLQTWTCTLKRPWPGPVITMLSRQPSQMLQTAPVEREVKQAPTSHLNST